MGHSILLLCPHLQPVQSLGKLTACDNCSSLEQAESGGNYCNICDANFEKEIRLNIHTSSHHKPGKLTSCDKYQPTILNSPTSATHHVAENTFQVNGDTRIPQLDGNASDIPDLDSSTSSNLSSMSLPQTSEQFTTLPTIYSANARSIFPKFDDLVDKLENSRVDLAQISETWQDVKKNDHNSKIDRLENQYGFKWYSYARSKYRDDGSLTGGGGCSILVNSRNWLSNQLDEIPVPQGLEVVWVKVAPKSKCELKLLIVCGIYSKPNSRKKTILSDHIAMNYYLLKMKYPEAKFVFLGDFNCYKPDHILQLSPQLRQLVHYSTHGEKTIDLIVTDIHTLYHPPVPCDPLLPDHPTEAAPSDHMGNLLIPRSVTGVVSSRAFRKLTVRPLSDSQISALGRWISQEPWDHLQSMSDVDSQLEHFTSTVFLMLNTIAPEKEIKIALDDPPWMNTRIKTIIRQRNREFDKKGKSEKWRKLMKKSKSMVRIAKKNFSENFISNLKDTDPSTWMKRMNKLGLASFQKENTGWQFLNEVKPDQILTDEMADYFANISKDFTPVDPSLLDLVPPNADFVSEVPCLPREHEVFDVLKLAKKTSSVPSDLPTTFVKEFLPFLAKPAHIIFSKSIIDGAYPTRWKTEYVTPHPKILPPVSYGDLRNLSLTEFLSKSFERFILRGTPSVKGLLYYITKYYDPGQYSVPGASCSHALLSIIDFILSNTDNPNKPTAVINLLADWSKAFNKVNHNIIMRILIALKIPQWLLRLILSYLQNRKMILRFRNCSSSPKDLPGGCPQGTLIGVILYILYINPIGFPGEITLQISDILKNYKSPLDIFPDLLPNNKSLPATLNAAKYMDDATIQEAVDLSTTLASKLDRSGPLPWWESSGKLLPNANTQLKSEIESIKTISDEREMVLNPDKTKIMVVNFTHNHQFQSLLTIPGSSTSIELTFETKLLGYWLTVNMKPDVHVSYILKIAYGRLWAISRLKTANVPNNDILHFFNVKIRSVLEYAAPVFTSMLTVENKIDIERTQKIALKVILNDEYSTYDQACAVLNTLSLESRRKDLSLNFALKCLKSEAHNHFFKQRTSTYYQLRKIKAFEEPFCHSERYNTSPIPYFTRLLNEHFSKMTGSY